MELKTLRLRSAPHRLGANGSKTMGLKKENTAITAAVGSPRGLGRAPHERGYLKPRLHGHQQKAGGRLGDGEARGGRRWTAGGGEREGCPGGPGRSVQVPKARGNLGHAGTGDEAGSGDEVGRVGTWGGEARLGDEAGSGGEAGTGDKAGRTARPHCPGSCPRAFAPPPVAPGSQQQH